MIISDKWGATYKYKPPAHRREVIVDPPSAASMGGMGGSGGGGSKDKLAELKGSGNKASLLMFLQAQAQMLSAPANSGGSSSDAGASGGNGGSMGAESGGGYAGDGGAGETGNGGAETGGGGGSSNSGAPAKPGEEKAGPTKEEKAAAAKAAEAAKESAANEAAAAQGDMKVNQITAVLETGGGKVTDLASAEIMSKTVESIIGKPAEEGEKSALGQEILKKTTAILGELVNSMTGLTDAVDPEQVKPSITSVTNTIGTLFDALYGMSGGPDEDLLEEEEEAPGNPENDDVNGENR